MSYNLYTLNKDGLPGLLAGIDTEQQWEEKRQHIRQQWLDLIGGIPERVPVRYTAGQQVKERDHTRQHLVYDTVYGDTITAYLLVPDETVPGADEDGRRPAIVALHPTNEVGKHDIATAEGRENRMYALELVSRGYIVLAPDALTAGERVYDGLTSFRSAPFYEQHPEWTTVAKNIVDHMQGVDLLCSLPAVDPGRIGTIGHSFGGYNSYFLAGMDERIKASVNSCGFSPFYGDHRPTHWGIRNWYTHLPQVTAYLSRNEVPCEFHEIAALAAPTPMFHYYGQQDAIFPHWEAIGACMGQLRELYRFLGVEERFRAVMTTGEHNFPPDIREMAYQFLDRWLKKDTQTI